MMILFQMIIKYNITMIIFRVTIYLVALFYLIRKFKYAMLQKNTMATIILVI